MAKAIIASDLSPVNEFTSVRLSRPVQKSVKVGDRFGRLIAVGPSFYVRLHNKVRRYLVVKCSCGAYSLVQTDKLRSGHTQSCGCLMREFSANLNRTHGLSRHPLHVVWASMRRRCEHPNCEAYPDYGGRGIKVCDEWKNSFVAFYEWSMANGWREGLEIDRYPNNDGNYEPDNCRWATRSQQANNHRRNRILTAFGESKTVKEWTQDSRCCVSYSTLISRVKYQRFSPEEMITRQSRNGHTALGVQSGGDAAPR